MCIVSFRFVQITDALRYMHQHRIMHRDIKPANVLVGANGALKIGDLGLGRQLSEQTMEAFSKVPATPWELPCNEQHVCCVQHKWCVVGLK